MRGDVMLPDAVNVPLSGSYISAVATPPRLAKCEARLLNNGDFKNTKRRTPPRPALQSQECRAFEPAASLRTPRIWPFRRNSALTNGERTFGANKWLPLSLLLMGWSAAERRLGDPPPGNEFVSSRTAPPVALSHGGEPLRHIRFSSSESASKSEIARQLDIGRTSVRRLLAQKKS